MESQALGTIKWKIALVADGGGLLELVVVRARVWLITVARATGSPLAGVDGTLVGREGYIVMVAIAQPQR